MAVKRFYFFGSYSSSPIFRPFIMEVESDNNGEFTIPTTGVGYNYYVKTSDGQTFAGVTGNLTITFPSPNTHYDVEISGLFPRIYFNNGSERLKIKEIKQWGDIVWGSMQNAFYGCSNLGAITATDAPDLTMVTNMNAMFYQCTSLTTLDVSNWDVSSVTSMSNMFQNCTSLTTLDVSNWDVSSVTNMGGMFHQCTSLTTLDVSNWDVSSVTNMGGMFQNCSSLTTLDVSGWDVSSVTSMVNMFVNCSSLTTLDVSGWDVSSVTSMVNMFVNCSSLTTLDVSGWDVSSVTNMGGMFQNCTSLTTLDVSAWDVSSVTNMSYMFNQCSSLTMLDVSNWDVSSVTNMQQMFYQCTALTTLDVSNWDVSSVTNMQQMFGHANANWAFNPKLDVSNWDVSSVTSMDRMFQNSNGYSNLIEEVDFSDPIRGSISLTQIRGMMAGTRSSKLLLQAGNLQSPVNIAGNPSNWIASPNMAEVKLIGMKNDVDTTVGFGSAGAMTGEAWKDLLESFDITQAKTYKLSVAAYSDMEAHLQGLGYIDIQDYLTQTSNNWTIIN